MTARQDTTPHYPDITVRLVGQDGNAFAIMGAVGAAMRHAGCTEDQIQEYLHDAMASDYDHLLQVTMSYVEVK